jgi:hypothetical protein
MIATSAHKLRAPVELADSLRECKYIHYLGNMSSIGGQNPEIFFALGTVLQCRHISERDAGILIENEKRLECYSSHNVSDLLKQENSEDWVI